MRHDYESIVLQVFDGIAAIFSAPDDCYKSISYYVFTFYNDLYFETFITEENH